MQNITIKTQFNNDYRRFLIPSSSTFEQLRDQISQLYKIEELFTLKYIDDEGDLISLTTNAELIEAIRFSNIQVPPILRLSIFTSSTCDITQDQQNQFMLSSGKIEDLPTLTESPTTTENSSDSSKEYPGLDISEWDAPKKDQPQPALPPSTITAVITVPIMEVVKKTIAQETKDLSYETSRSVQNSSSTTTAQTHKQSASVMENFPSIENSLLCSELSKQIADVCRNLSKTTSELCETMSKITTDDTASNTTAADVNNTSNDTVRICHKLSKETAEMLEKQARETEKHSVLLKEQSKKLSDLTRQTAASGMLYSTDTTASGSAASNEILNSIKGL